MSEAQDEPEHFVDESELVCVETPGGATESLRVDHRGVLDENARLLTLAIDRGWRLCGRATAPLVAARRARNRPSRMACAFSAAARRLLTPGNDNSGAPSGRASVSRRLDRLRVYSAVVAGGRLLDHEAALWHLNDQGRVVEVADLAVRDPCRHRFEDLSIEPDGVASRSEGQPVEVSCPTPGASRGIP